MLHAKGRSFSWKVKRDAVKTIRKQLIACLNENEASGRDLSKMIGISEKEVYEHLPHVSRTVNAKGKRLDITPAECFACGYVFKHRKRFSPPSRCPQCKDEHIQDPLYRIN